MQKLIITNNSNDVPEEECGRQEHVQALQLY